MSGRGSIARPSSYLHARRSFGWPASLSKGCLANRISHFSFEWSHLTYFLNVVRGGLKHETDSDNGGGGRGGCASEFTDLYHLIDRLFPRHYRGTGGFSNCKHRLLRRLGTGGALGRSESWNLLSIIYNHHV